MQEAPLFCIGVVFFIACMLLGYGQAFIEFVQATWERTLPFLKTIYKIQASVSMQSVFLIVLYIMLRQDPKKFK